MEGPDESVFRPTVVAAPPVAPPVLMRYPDAKLIGNGDYLDVGIPSPGAPLPDDFTLQELLAVDLHSPEALLALIVDYGAVTLNYAGDDGRRRRFEHLPREETWRGPFPLVQQAWDSFAEGADIHPGSVQSVEALRLHLRAARSMSRHLLAYLSGSEPQGLLEAWTSEGYNEPRSLPMAWDWWQDHMNAALSPFRMFIEVRRPDGRATSGGEVPPATLYTGCALQLAQYLATDARALICANDRCRKPFTRQRAPAKRRRNPDQFHTTGVLYCSRECLKRKSERERRKRQADKVRGTK